MSKDSLILPDTRSWRDIPQQVKPRAMSREGKRRLLMKAVRVMAGVMAIATVAWGAWQVTEVLHDPSAMPDAAKSDRVKSLALVTDGVLDKEWLARTLALPADATLMGTDLMALRAKLLSFHQVRSATLVRNFPDTLTVRISERSPVARVMAQEGSDKPLVLLVGRDGVPFEGAGFDPAMVESLPWLASVRLERTASGFAPIPGMSAVADLLASAKLEAEGLYRTWQVVDLGHLAPDGQLEVHTKAGMKVVFGTSEDYLRQIARLDLLIDASNDPTRPLTLVDLSLGSQVPVAYGKAAPMLTERPAAMPEKSVAPGPTITFPAFSNLQPEARRGL